MPAAKKLIEVALPLDAINAASAREKSIRHGHPSTLHLWWARRPLAAARAVIFTSLVDDPDDPDALPAFVEACRQLPGDGPNVRAKGATPRMRLFDFIERLVTWEATTDETIMEKARELIRIATKGEPPPLLDPFAGGGSIPLEAQRLGLEAHASDLNPVAVMINKAMIEIPPRFAGMAPVNPRDREAGTAGDAKWKGAAGLAADVRYYGEWMREQAFQRIGHLYPKHKGETVIAWLWARTVTCPNPACQAKMPLMSSFYLSKRKGRNAWLEPVSNIDSSAVYFQVRHGNPNSEEKTVIQCGTGLINARGKKVKSTFMCPVCNAGIAKGDYIDLEADKGRMGSQATAIVTQGNSGRNYYPVTPDQVKVAVEEAPLYLAENNTPTPQQASRGTFASNAQGRIYGFRVFADYFTPRQLVALTTFSDLVHEARDLVTQDALATGLEDDNVPLREGGRGARAYGEAVSVYLAFTVSRITDFMSTITRWLADSVGRPKNVFARQAIPMMWDFAEVNLFSGRAGSWNSILTTQCQGITSFARAEAGFAEQADAASVQFSTVSLLSTDPPYYDNIDYADLSDYFYVWMRRSLRDIYPDIFSTLLVPKSAELVASTFRHGSKEEAKEHFEIGMLETFTNIRRFVRADFPQTVYYAFKQQDAGFLVRNSNSGVASTGWETMLTSMLAAGFSIVGTWPMRTEGGSRMNAMGANALASSIVLVCRPRPEDAPTTSRRRFLDALRAELPAAITEMKTGSIAPVDMAQATIGPGMAIYSRYSAVLEADGRALTVRTALGLINAALDEVLAEQDAHLDPETRFAVGWFEQHGFEKDSFGGADVLARGKNTSVDSVALAGLVESVGGTVRLIHWKEYDPGAYDPGQDKRPTVWEGSHHLIERLNSHGETGAAALYNRLPGDIAESVRDLAYRLYHICDRKGWAEDALDYNTLVSSWSEITRLAASERSRATQQDLFD